MKLNHWSEIRRQARELRKKVLQASGGNLSPDALLSVVAGISQIKRVGLPKGDGLLYTAHAILHSGFVFYDNSFEKWQMDFNQMHEYAHHFLNHGSTTLCRHEDFDPEASEDAVGFGEQRIEGYGPHERRELEANLFTREFFLPCDENKLKIRYFRTTPQQADGVFARKLVGQSTDYHEFSKNKELTPFQG